MKMVQDMGLEGEMRALEGEEGATQAPHMWAVTPAFVQTSCFPVSKGAS